MYTRQILIGLDYLHSQRVVHRDIKGANILVEKSGRIKLADFGMAKMLEFVDIERNNHAKKAIKGSAYWMAPVIRKSEVTLGCDVWSVGCTVIEMASAKPPWCGVRAQVQAMYKIASSTALPTLPENNLSADAKAFILHCLKRNVEEKAGRTDIVDESVCGPIRRTKRCIELQALKYEQHDGSYSNFPDNQSLVSSHVSLEDPSEETDLDENDEDEDEMTTNKKRRLQRRQRRRQQHLRRRRYRRR